MNLQILMKCRCVDVNIQIIFDVDDRSNAVCSLSLQMKIYFSIEESDDDDDDDDNYF